MMRLTIATRTSIVLSLVAATAVLSMAPAPATQTIRCTAPKKSDVVLRLDAERVADWVVSCIDGDFTGDMTPCAANGTYSLSDAKAPFSIVRILGEDYWLLPRRHDGGIVQYWISSLKIYFEGVFGGPDTNGPHGDRWSFLADRLTGEAVLQIKGVPKATYRCNPMGN